MWNPVRAARLARLPHPDPEIHNVGPDTRGGRGAAHLALLRHWGLTADDALFEIGCGVGRLAYEVAHFLSPRGRYAGIDISPDAIAWLDANYARRVSNFRFDLIDARNPLHRPDASTTADTIRFPHPDATFDFACAFAVFMHMQIPEIENYLRELRRVVRPGARTFVTFMAISPHHDAPHYNGRDYVPVAPGVYSLFPDEVGRSLAYDDVLIREMIAAAGLELVDSFEGWWHGAQTRPRSGGPASGADAYILRAP